MSTPLHFYAPNALLSESYLLLSPPMSVLKNWSHPRCCVTNRSTGGSRKFSRYLPFTVTSYCSRRTAWRSVYFLESRAATGTLDQFLHDLCCKVYGPVKELFYFVDVTIWKGGKEDAHKKWYKEITFHWGKKSLWIWWETITKKSGKCWNLSPEVPSSGHGVKSFV